MCVGGVRVKRGKRWDGKFLVKARVGVSDDKDIQGGGYCRPLVWDDNVGVLLMSGALDGGVVCDTWVVC